MSGPEPIRPPGFARGDHAAMMAPLLREWVLLRERETELLRRIADLVERFSHSRRAVEEPPDAATETAASSGDRPGEPPAHPQDDPTWIDRTIEAVLAGAFSADDEPEDSELPAVDLLLLRSGDTWVGMPWDRVSRLGLSDETQPPSWTPLSLREILGHEGAGNGVDDAAEPYCLTWETTGGPRSLCCEVLGGVVAATAAAARQVDLIWLPDDSAVGGRLMPLVEFFAWSGRDGSPEVEGPVRGFDDPVPPGDSSLTPAGSMPAESAPAPAAEPALAPAAEPAPAPAPEPAPAPAPEPVPAQAPAPVQPETEPKQDPDLSPRPVRPAGIPPAGVIQRSARGVTRFGAMVPPEAGDATPRETGPARRPDMPAGAPSGEFRHPQRPVVGLRSVLVSVRYLPARVAIARACRSLGWFVLETADTAELPDMLRRVHHTVVFIEAPERPDPGWTRELARARDGGARIVGVSSRLRGAAGDPWHGLETVPHLLFPFQEAELEKLIGSLG